MASAPRTIRPSPEQLFGGRQLETTAATVVEHHAPLVERYGDDVIVAVGLDVERRAEHLDLSALELHDERPPGIVGHLEVGFAFEPDATLEKPELHGIVDFRLGIEVGDRTVLKQALRTPPPVDDEFAVLRIRKDAPYLTVETQGDAQHQRDGNHDGGDAKKNAAAPAAREGVLIRAKMRSEATSSRS